MTTIDEIAAVLGCAPDAVLPTVQRWREALEFYAQPTTYEEEHRTVMTDYGPEGVGVPPALWEDAGEMARDALGQVAQEGDRGN